MRSAPLPLDVIFEVDCPGLPAMLLRLELAFGTSIQMTCNHKNIYDDSSVNAVHDPMQWIPLSIPEVGTVLK